MKTYWTISDGIMLILENGKPTHCELEGIELEPLDHESAERLVEDVGRRRFGSQFVLVRNTVQIGEGKVELWRYHDTAEFTLTAKPFTDADGRVRLPSCKTATEEFGDISFPVGENNYIWFLFVVADDSAKTDGARQRLDDNLRSVFG